MDNWDAEAFEGALSAENLDAAWTMLSHMAEDLMAEPGRGGHRHAQQWRPRLLHHERSKAAPSFEGLTLVQLRRLLRRSASFVTDLRIIISVNKAGKQIVALLPKAPWLEELPYFALEHWCDGEAARPIPKAHEVPTFGAIHPVCIVEDATTSPNSVWLLCETCA